MAERGEGNQLLEGLRVFDLAAEPAVMTGRILADLGASVIRPELPEGDRLRLATPLGPDGTSLRFVAWCTGKTTLPVAGPDDPALGELLYQADVVISTPGCPGTLEVDSSMAPNAAWVTVTAFGLESPRADWRASDLGIMASTGNLYCTGDADRPPVRCAEPASYAHGGVEAAFAALTAVASCRPQQVDVSLQEAVMVASLGGAGRAIHTGQRGQRLGANIGGTREIWPCRDGYVSFGLRGGRARQVNLETVTRLVDEAGLATPALTERGWAAYDPARLPQEELAAISAPIAAYFMRHSMVELYEIACATNLMLAPVNSPAELLRSAQLAARGFFAAPDDAGDSDPAPPLPRRFVKATSLESSLLEPGVRDDPSTGSLELSGSGWPARAARATPFAWARPRQDRAREGTPYGTAEAGSRGAWAGTRLLELGSGAAGPIATR